MGLRRIKVGELLRAAQVIWITAVPGSGDVPAPRIEAILDSAFQYMNMERGDIGLPVDLIARDKHRLDWSEALFREPMTVINQVEAYRKIFSDSALFAKSGWIENFYKRPAGILQDLSKVNSGIGKKSFQTFEDLRTHVLNLFQASCVLLDTMALPDLEERRWLLNAVDSLLVPTHESESASVYELKAAETAELKLAGEFFDRVDRVPYQDLTMEGWGIFQDFRGLINAISQSTLVFPDTLSSWMTPCGTVVFGTLGVDQFTDSAALIFDPGGDDTYSFFKNGMEGSPGRRLRIIADLGGNDIYHGSDFQWGSGVFGVSLVMDQAGDDRYFGGNFSLGSGLFGLGVVEDHSGSDLYSAKSLSLGSGVFGMGLLLDRSGNDLYQSQAYSQAFGFTQGLGAIVDWEGNDNYLTTSPYQDFLRYDDHYLSFSQGAGLGYRPLASGGAGVLLDLAGNDNYRSDIYGQGAAYWFSFGVLFDGGGRDQYTSHQYAQGAGVHYAHGLLWDREGDDRYFSHGVSQGCGHDVGFGWLLDERGMDDYRAFGLSQGGGNADAISLFVDGEGNDAYTGRTPYNMMGYSDFRRDYGMIGIFADGGGTDWYADTNSNNKVGLKSTWGISLDMPGVKGSKSPARVDSGGDPSAPGLLSSTIDSLFVQASAAAEKFQINVLPAREAIAARADKKETIPFLLFKLSTESARERHALRDILKKIIASGSTSITGLIVDSLGSKNLSTLNMSADFCRENQIAACVPSLQALLSDAAWPVRFTAAWSLSKIGDSAGIHSLVALIDDPHPYVRMRAAYGLGLHLPWEILLPLASRLVDQRPLIIRNNFVHGILSREEQADLSWVFRVMEGCSTSWGMRALAPLIPAAPQTRKNKKLLKKHWKRFPVDLRRSIRWETDKVDNSFWKNVLEVL